MQTQPKLGTEKVKTALTNGIKVGMNIAEIADDGIKWHEWPALGFQGTKLPGVYRDFIAAKEEFADMDAEDIKEVSAHIAAEVDLKNDKVEQIIETTAELLADSIIVAKSGVNVFNRWKALFGKN